MKKTTRYICEAGIIAALYTVLTFFSSVFSLAYGPVQFRLSEALTLLPIISPSAILGLTVGCFFSNLGSFGAIDLIFGTLATFLSAILTRYLGKFKLRSVPLLAPLPPVLINSVFIGLEISIFYLDGFTAMGFLVSALWIGLSELAVCYALGLPVYMALSKRNYN